MKITENQLRSLVRKVINEQTDDVLSDNGTMVTLPNGDLVWYDLNGQLHRTDGPSVEWADGSKSWGLH